MPGLGKTGYIQRICLKSNRQESVSTYIQNQSGQSIILISVMIMSFLLFFAFVINTGVLITAKISLQTAADAAAYAGAAVQARQLNSISYLNYDLRRQYKKFVYRYVVIGNFSRDKFTLGSSPNRNYGFPVKEIDPTTLASSSKDMNIPVICIPVTVGGQADDTCVKASHPNTANQIKTQLGVGASINSSTAEMFKQIEAIENVQGNICKARGQVNIYVALAWLFRGNVDDAALKKFFDVNLQNNKLTPQDKDKVREIVRSVTDRLGIFPRNIITKMRINTLEQFLNTPPQTEVNLEKVQALEKSKGADAYERTIQAYQSAFTNLNENTFPEGVTLTELQNARQIALKALNVNFNTYVHQIDQTQTDPNNPRNCIMKVIAIPVAELPVSVHTDATQNLFTHYAVKLTAKAKLFMPAPLTVDLEAIAGAKPFGSRIGPRDLRMEDFVEPLRPNPIIGNTDILNQCSSVGNPGCNVPNLKLAKNPAPGVKSLTLDYLQEIAQNLARDPVDANDLRSTMKLATAPNPYEVGQYNILPAPPSAPDQMKYEFISYWSEPKGPNPGSPVYRFYAPLFPADKSSNLTEEIRKALAAMFPSTNVGVDPNTGYDPADMRTTIENQLIPYVTTNLQQPNGNTENNESYTFAAVELPIPERNLKVGKYWLNQTEQVLTSWAPDYVRTGPDDFNGTGTFKPRFGYSVKFVTMQDLLSQGMQNTDDDLSKLKH